MTLANRTHATPASRSFRLAHRASLSAWPLVLLVIGVMELSAQGWGVAARHHVNWGGPKTRAGDVQGYGVSVRRGAHAVRGPQWEFSLALDHLEYDLDTPIHATGVSPRASDKPADAFTQVTRGQLDVIRRFRNVARMTPYVLGGVGVYSIEVDEANGQVEGGGTFQLRTEAPTTAGITLGVGSEWRIAGRASLGFGVSYSRTLSKYRVTEVRSGATGTISPFAPLGVGTQLIVRW